MNPFILADIEPVPNHLDDLIGCNALPGQLILVQLKAFAPAAKVAV